MQCCFVSSHREMINFSAANAVAHIRVIHPFLCLNKPSSIKWPHPSQAPNLAHSRHLSSLSVRFGHFSSPESMPFLQIPGLSPGVVVQ